MEADSARRGVIIKQIKRVFDGFLKVDEAVFSLERYDGSIQKDLKRLSLERGDSAGVLLLDCSPIGVVGQPTPRVWLIEQFRYSTYEKGPGWIQEVPTGVVEFGEDPMETVQREAREEAGIEVRDLEHISTFYVSPGGTSERIFLFFGRVDGQAIDQGRDYGQADEGEDIKLISCAAKTFMKEAKLGRIDDAKTLIAGLWLAANWERVSQI